MNDRIDKWVHEVESPTFEHESPENVPLPPHDES